jgi:protein-disulfide isomerase
VRNLGLASLLIFVTSLFIVATPDALLAQTPVQGKLLAEVNGQPISQEEIDKAIAGQLGKLQEQIYNLRRQRLEAVIRDRLLAQEGAKRGISMQKLLDAEVTSKVGLVTEEEIERFYQANKARFKADVDEAATRDQIRSQLQGQKITAQREAFLQSLRRDGKVAINLEPPPVVRIEVPINGAPVRGTANAPVTIVEFSDFHCPFCKRVLPTLKEVEAKYGDKVKLVFRDYPIDQLHPAARKAHEAARCAHEQGKFWAYHDVLFDKAPRASADDLKTYAREVGLDLVKFDRCVASAKHKEVVQKDLEEGARLGVSGTPAFFINGELLSGAQPLESFVRVVERELARLR